MKLLYKVIMLVCAFGLSLGTLSAQYTIQGKIVDNKKNPIPGARVTSYTDPSCITSTGVDGSFELYSPMRKIDRITVEYAGYKRVSRNAEDDMIVKMRRAYKETWSLTFQMSFPDATNIQPSYGGMLSWCRRVGFYFRGVGSVMSGDYRYSDDYAANPDRYARTGNRMTSYMSFTGGLMIRTCSVLNIYAGVGASERNVAYEVVDPYSFTQNTYYYWHSTHSYSSLAIDMGIVLKLRPIAFTAGCTYVPNYGFVGNYGVGFCF